MRGVATGGDGQATTSQPSVGMYLDEQPITTVQGNLDIHLYDIARVEALAGPQGTLYGASSQAGTIRIITNKPDPSAFAAGYSLEAQLRRHGRRRLRRRGLRQPADGRQRGAAPRRLVRRTTQAGSTTSSPRAPLRGRPSRRPPTTSSRRTTNSSRTTTTRSTPSARARRCASTWARTGRSRRASCTRSRSRRAPGATTSTTSWRTAIDRRSRTSATSSWTTSGTRPA